MSSKFKTMKLVNLEDDTQINSDEIDFKLQQKEQLPPVQQKELDILMCDFDLQIKNLLSLNVNLDDKLKSFKAVIKSFEKQVRKREKKNSKPKIVKFAKKLMAKKPKKKDQNKSNELAPINSVDQHGGEQSNNLEEIIKKIKWETY